MNVLVTGNKGFVGSHAYRVLKDNGYNVFGMDLPEYDFTYEKSVKKFFTNHNIRTIIHIGAFAGLNQCMEDPLKAIKTNVYGTSVLLDYAHKNQCRFIYISTWAVNGQLEHPYDITKLMAEKAVNLYSKVYGLQTMILRLATMYGPGMRKNGVIWNFIEKSIKNEDIIIQGDGNQFRQFLWIEDAARAILKAVDNFKPNYIIDVQSEERTSVRQLANMVYPKNSKKIIYTNKRQGDEESFYISPANAENILGWKAEVSIIEGINKLRGYIK